jgi:chorismate synthase
VHGDRRLDARLAGALMGIQAIKGVEVGDGFEIAASRGSLAHDEIVPTDDGIRRTSGRSGGTEGGMSTGEVLRVRAAMKPISTVPRALRTVDVDPTRQFYDSSTSAHHHFYNVDTGELTDIPLESVSLQVATALPPDTEQAAVDVVVRIRGRRAG